MDSIINRVVDGSPSPHNTITFHQGGQQTRLDLRELDRLAGRVALYLKRLGVGQGDRIGLISRNRLEWVLLDLAALKIKAVTAGFEAGKFGPPSELIARYNLRFIFTDQPADEEERIIPIDTLLSSISDIPEAADLAPAKNWIVGARAWHAAHLLVHAGLSAESAAERLGYADTKALRRHVAAVWNVSPTQLGDADLEMLLRDAVAFLGTREPDPEAGPG